MDHAKFKIHENTGSEIKDFIRPPGGPKTSPRTSSILL